MKEGGLDNMHGLNEKVTPVGIEPTPFRTGTLNQRLNRSAKASYEKIRFSSFDTDALDSLLRTLGYSHGNSQYGRITCSTDRNCEFYSL